jgi:AGZA family xanthine/uracil permease-like MFS transporter
MGGKISPAHRSRNVPRMLATRFEFATAIIAPPPSLGPTFLKMDIAHALTPTMMPFVFVFLFMLTFDAIGTLIGVCEQAGFMRDNKLPRASATRL